MYIVYVPQTTSPCVSEYNICLTYGTHYYALLYINHVCYACTVLHTQQGLQMMQAQQYLCVFTDVHMPIMSGFDQVKIVYYCFAKASITLF
jgi:CheY-like chemotaxis protein